MLVNPTVATALSFFGSPMGVPEAAVIFQPGEIADGVYVVRSGRIIIELLDAIGIPLRMETVCEYGVLGLPAAISQLPHCLRALAAENSELIFLPSEELRRLIRSNSELGTEVITALAAELQDLQTIAAVRE